MTDAAQDNTEYGPYAPLRVGHSTQANINLNMHDKRKYGEQMRLPPGNTRCYSIIALSSLTLRGLVRLSAA